MRKGKEKRRDRNSKDDRKEGRKEREGGKCERKGEGNSTVNERKKETRRQNSE